MTAAVNKATPVLGVERIEDCLPFWEALGFRATIQVAGEHGLNFCALSNGNDEVMYQTFASIAEDLPQVLDTLRASKTFLFVEVPDLTAVEQALAGHPVFLPRRKTFYGSQETGMLEPGGHFVTFAQFAAG